MTWIIRRASMFTCPYLRHEETPRTHATYDASQKVAKRFRTRRDARDACDRLRHLSGDEEAYVVRLKRKPKVATDTLVAIRKEREALGAWLLTNVRAGIFFGPNTNADGVKLLTVRDFVTLILAGAHVIETGAQRPAKATNQ